MKIAFRMDDITADMNWDNFLRMKELFDRYGIRPLLGVVPRSRDPKLNCGRAREDFWEYLVGLQEAGWTIAQHGCYHVYTTGKGGLFPLNLFSEYAGVPFEEQREKIRLGKRSLEEKGIETDIFMAPGHTYDKNTLRALRESGFCFLTDGFGREPYRREGLVFLPIAKKRSACFGPGEGYTTLVLHVNGMSAEEMDWYEGMFSRHREKLISYERLLELPVKERGFAGNLAEYLTAGGKRILVEMRSAGRA